MEHAKVKLNIAARAEGLFPIGYLTELLYQAIEYLEREDVDAESLLGILPLKADFVEDHPGNRLELKVEFRND